MEKHQRRWRTIYVLMGLITVALVACGAGTSKALTSSDVSASEAGIATTTSATPPATLTNNISFTTTGQIRGTYTITSTIETSKLRHGHKEFTIEVASGGQSVIMAFYGYEGPRSYTLEGLINGGDVHINLGKKVTAWDLPMTPGTACSLNIESDIPTSYTGIDRMKGSFSCPHLTSTNPNTRRESIAVQKGHFDLLIVVES